MSGRTSGYDVEIPDDQYLARQLRDLRRDVDKAMRLAISGGGGSSGYLVGQLYTWPGTSTPPAGAPLLELNGQSVLAATYADLAAVHPEWVSGANLVLPDYGTQVLAGRKSGDSDFGTAGASLGATSHHHDLSDVAWAQATLSGGTLRMRRLTSGITGYSSTVTIAGTTNTASAAETNAIALDGVTDDASSIQPTRVVRFYVAYASALGEFDPDVQNALSAVVATHTADLAIWTSERPTKHVVTTATSLQVLGLDGFDEYKIRFVLDVASVANSLTAQLAINGVPTTTTLYLSQYTVDAVAASTAAGGTLAAQWGGFQPGSRFRKHFVIEMFDLNATAYTKYEARGLASETTAGTFAAPAQTLSTGEHRVATAHNGIIFTASSGSVSGYYVLERKKYA